MTNSDMSLVLPKIDKDYRHLEERASKLSSLSHLHLLWALLIREPKQKQF